MAYSTEPEAAVLKKMLPPKNVPSPKLSREEGICEATLHSWRKEARVKCQLLPDADGGPEGWSLRDKFAAVVETAAMNASDLAEYCRKRLSNDSPISEARSGPAGATLNGHPRA